MGLSVIARARAPPSRTSVPTGSDSPPNHVRAFDHAGPWVKEVASSRVRGVASLEQDPKALHLRNEARNVLPRRRDEVEIVRASRELPWPPGQADVHVRRVVVEATGPDEVIPAVVVPSLDEGLPWTLGGGQGTLLDLHKVAVG